MASADPWDSTVVTAEGGGVYSAVIGPRWVLARVPQGGVVAAIAARAMAAELGTAGEAQSLRSLHGIFAEPVPDGRVVVEVSLLRRGRSMSHLQATVRDPQRSAGYTALAVFGAERPGFAFTELQLPTVPAPDECRSLRTHPPSEDEVPDWQPWPFWTEILEGRQALGHHFWDPAPRDVAESASWYRFDQEPIGPDGNLDPLAALVMADMMPQAVFERLGPTEDRWFAPSVDLTVHLMAAATPGWVLAHTRAHVAADGYASVESALWDPRGPDGCRLVAWATQQMFFTAMPSDPAGLSRSPGPGTSPRADS